MSSSIAKSREIHFYDSDIINVQFFSHIYIRYTGEITIPAGHIIKMSLKNKILFQFSFSNPYFIIKTY
jgi:hypothetical protein